LLKAYKKLKGENNPTTLKQKTNKVIQKEKREKTKEFYESLRSTLSKDNIDVNTILFNIVSNKYGNSSKDIGEDFKALLNRAYLFVRVYLSAQTKNIKEIKEI
jgi:hypothetical protein